MIAGINIIASDLCIEKRQFRFPRSGKIRIRNKWKKNDKNFKFIPVIFKFGNSIIAHPSLVDKLKNSI